MNSWIVDAAYPFFKDHTWHYVESYRIGKHYVSRKYACHNCMLSISINTGVSKLKLRQRPYKCIDLQMAMACT